MLPLTSQQEKYLFLIVGFLILYSLVPDRSECCCKIMLRFCSWYHICTSNWLFWPVTEGSLRRYALKCCIPINMSSVNKHNWIGQQALLYFLLRNRQA